MSSTPLKLALVAAFGFALAFTLSCSNLNKDGDMNENGSSPRFVSSSSSGTSGLGSSSSRPDGSSSSNGGSGNNITNYKIKQIGSQTWMAENLNYNVIGSVCYDYLESNCNQYGRLYYWATAMALPSKCNETSSTDDADCAIKTSQHQGICPAGWHIPSNPEWSTLIDFVGRKTSGTKLKATSGWVWFDNGNGTDDYGFTALPSGCYERAGTSPGFRGNIAEWWSASENNSVGAYKLNLSGCCEEALLGHENKNYRLLSVRCVHD